MPFFQNPLTADFIGVWLTEDVQYSLNFKCPRNSGRGDEIVQIYSHPPFDLSGSDADGNPKQDLTINFAIDPDFKYWTEISVDATDGAASSSAVSIYELANALNNNTQFASYFTAIVEANANAFNSVLRIRQKLPVTRMRFYIANGGAEEVLKFNFKAGVAELPNYFDRHTIENRFNYSDSNNMLIQLGTTGVDADVINNAVDPSGASLGYSAASVKEDWELLRGRTTAYKFKKQTVDGSNRITEIIEYNAGAGVGDLAKMYKYVYTGANTNPDEITMQPYVLQSGDLITP